MSSPGLAAEMATARGVRGVVVAAPLAASIGAAVLRRSGSAYDAVIAAALAETVLLPPKCGLAGDLIALRIRPGEPVPEVLVAIGTAPADLAGEVRRRGHLPGRGGLSVGVPAAPAGYAALADAATLPLGELAAPAISLAAGGAPWARICADLTAESHRLLEEHNPGGTRYLPDGRPAKQGSILRLPGLAMVLEALVERGASLFTGDLGRAVVERVRAAGGVLQLSDLEQPVPAWERAAHRSVSSWDLWTTPAPTHGPVLLDALAEADLSRPASILPAVRASSRRAADLHDTPSAGGTSLVGAATADGTVVLLMHSNSFPTYGSGLVVAELDLVLSNRAGRGFSADPAHPNHPAPGRRPATTLHLWAAGPVGQGAQLAGGTPGGANQMPWNAQLVSEVLGSSSSLGAAVTSPRWGWDEQEHRLLAEDGVDPTKLALEPGESVELVPERSLRASQVVFARPEPGVYVEAAADPRCGAIAVPV